MAYTPRDTAQHYSNLYELMTQQCRSLRGDCPVARLRHPLSRDVTVGHDSGASCIAKYVDLIIFVITHQNSLLKNRDSLF